MTAFSLDGTLIRTEADFHAQFRRVPGVPSFYGKNLDALWDTLMGLVELPLKIVWENAEASRAAMGEDFYRIVAVMRDAERETAAGETRFTLDLQ